MNILDDTTDVNRAPISVSLNNTSVQENLTGGYIATISGEDPDGDKLTYSLTHLQDVLEINGSILKFKEGISVDYENMLHDDHHLSFFIRATDPEDYIMTNTSLS